MFTIAVYALALAMAWVAIVGRLTAENLVVGFVIGLLIVLVGPKPPPLKPRRVPGQLVALLLYILILLRDIILSGLDVARRVLSPDMKLKPGILAVDSQDEDRNAVVLALSANYLSLTPGELVVDIADDHLIYVHSLDVEASAKVADSAQTKRLVLLNRVIGKNS
ncbi:MAG: Na+/H+ antiporter subunit E [Anaerolineae bacterium]